MTKFRKLVCFLFVAAALSTANAEATYRILTLPSGKPIKVLGVGELHFTAGEPALMLKYETDISMDDKAALENEAAEIWLSFRPDVEKANMKNAVLSANEHVGPGILTRSRGFNFVFSRGTDGNWSRK
jgi:hypothetical protein